MLKTLCVSHDPLNAIIIKDRLTNEGIPAFVLNQQHATMDWFVINALGGVRVSVPHR